MTTWTTHETLTHNSTLFNGEAQYPRPSCFGEVWNDPLILKSRCKSTNEGDRWRGIGRRGTWPGDPHSAGTKTDGSRLWERWENPGSGPNSDSIRRGISMVPRLNRVQKGIRENLKERGHCRACSPRNNAISVEEGTRKECVYFIYKRKQGR